MILASIILICVFLKGFFSSVPVKPMTQKQLKEESNS